MLTVLFTIVIVAIVGVVIFFIYKEYTSSRSYRVNKSVKNFRKIKKEEEKTILKFINDAEEILSDEDRILTIIRKINTGEEVKIPIAAFQYIYTRLNQICVVDKKGNVQIVNSEEFRRFQQTAINLLDKDNEYLKDSIADDSGIHMNVFTTKKYPDGTIIKKNNINGDITILKPDGTKYINKNELNDLIIERPYEEEDDNNNKKNKGGKDNSGDVNRLKNDNKNLAQENAYLKKQAEDNKSDANKKNVKDKEQNEEKIDIKNTENETKENVSSQDLDETNSATIIIDNNHQKDEVKENFTEENSATINLKTKSDNESSGNKKEENNSTIKIGNNQKITNLEKQTDVENKEEVEDKNENSLIGDSLLDLDSIMNKYKSEVNQKEKKVKLKSIEEETKQEPTKI